jgi:hypothetical protein
MQTLDELAALLEPQNPYAEQDSVFFEMIAKGEVKSSARPIPLTSGEWGILIDGDRIILKNGTIRKLDNSHKDAVE